MHDTSSLWTALRAMFAQMHRSIGAALSERAFIAPCELKRLRAWLSPVVAMARKVVLIEALLLARDAVLGPRKPSAPRVAPKPARQRKPSIRLWPRPKRSTARIRQLGPPVLVREIWRDQAREARARHMAAMRAARTDPGGAIARRFEALARLIRQPQRAIRALARKLLLNRKFALLLAAKRTPRTRLFESAAYDGAWGLSFDLCVAHARCDSS